jgi:hypothetical protein
MGFAALDPSYRLQVRRRRPLSASALVTFDFLAVGGDAPLFLAHDDRGADVLAHRQHATAMLAFLRKS